MSLTFTVTEDATAAAYTLHLRSWKPGRRSFRTIYEDFPGKGTKAKPQGLYRGRRNTYEVSVRETTAKAAQTKVMVWTDLVDAGGSLAWTAGEPGDPLAGSMSSCRLESMSEPEEIGPFVWHFTLTFVEVV